MTTFHRSHVARAVGYATQLASAAALLGLSGSARLSFAHGRQSMSTDPDVHNIAYDGRFAFARLRYVTGPGGYYYRGLPAWAHGYNTAEVNLMKIMREVTAL